MTDRTTSWVHTTCPPGWGATREREHHWSVYCCEPSGQYRFVGEVPTRELACRLAWERWALDVLGPVTWQQGPEHAPALGIPRSCYVTARGKQCWVHNAHRRYTVVYECVDEEHPGNDPTCTDPVEALARLAALVLAVEGPRC